MNEVRVSGQELWQLADRLSAAHPTGTSPTTVESVAEAFGVTPDVVRQHLLAIRAQEGDASEIGRLRAENARLQQQIQQSTTPSQPEPRDQSWLREHHESTSLNDGYIETVHYERTRQPAYAPVTVLIVFAIVAIIMFSWFSASSRAMDRDFESFKQGNRPPFSPSSNYSPAIQRLLEEQSKRSGR